MFQISWGSVEPSFWDSIFPFAGPFLGVSLPIILGFSYYKYQRKVDRVEQMHAEKRQAYRECLSGFAELAAHNGQRLNDPNVEPDGLVLKAAMKGDSLAALYGSDEVAKLAKDCMKELMFKDDSGIHIPDLLIAMKNDLQKTLEITK